MAWEGRFARFFAWMTDGYGRLLELALRRRLAVIGGFYPAARGGRGLIPLAGQRVSAPHG